MKVLHGITLGLLWACLVASTLALVFAANEVRMLAHDARVLMCQAVEGIDYDKPLIAKE